MRDRESGEDEEEWAKNDMISHGFVEFRFVLSNFNQSFSSISQWAWVL